MDWLVMCLPIKDDDLNFIASTHVKVGETSDSLRLPSDLYLNAMTCASKIKFYVENLHFQW